MPFGRRQFASFKDDAQKTVVRQVSYGLHLDKYDSMAKFWNERSAKIRSSPGLKHIEVAVCGKGRVNFAYEFTDLASFKQYMESDFYQELKNDVLKADFHNADV